MQLTPGERKRLRTLLAWRRKPPTYASMLPKGVALVVIWCVLLVAFAVLVAGAGSPLTCYCLGLATLFPILALNLIVTSIRRWRVNDAIMNWDWLTRRSIR
jgi:uncharacterized membrane protein YidH (DUF202 family)